MSHVAAVLKYVETIASRGVEEAPSPVILELDTFAKREAVVASKTLAASSAVPGNSVGEEDVVMDHPEEIIMVPSYPAVASTNKVRCLL